MKAKPKVHRRRVFHFSEPDSLLRYFVELRYSRSHEELVRLAGFLRVELSVESRKDLLRVLPWDKAEKVAEAWGMKMPWPSRFYGAPHRGYERKKPRRKIPAMEVA